VHLQLAQKSTNKEQLWSFVTPVFKKESAVAAAPAMASLKRTMSGASLGSTTSTSTHGKECICFIFHVIFSSFLFY
jgi:hypothetical protein